MSGARIEETPLRIRIALSLGALLLAGGAVMGTALASAAEQPPAPPTAQPTPAPAPPMAEPTRAPSARPAPPGEATTAPQPDGRPGKPLIEGKRPGRVPTAIPAGPVGDLHLPAIVEGAGN